MQFCLWRVSLSKKKKKLRIMITKPPLQWKFWGCWQHIGQYNLLWKLGFVHSVFEGISEVFIKALVGGNYSLASIGHIAKDVMSILDLLQTYSFSHVRKQSNAVTHALAERIRFFFQLFGWRIFQQMFLIFVVVDFLVNK